MNAKELRTKDVAALQKELQELQKAHFSLRMQHATQQLQNTCRLKRTRRDRAFALDAARHFSINGTYLRCTALPDRWASWWLGAVPAGLGIIREQKPAAIWSTYPIATAHLIAMTLHRLSGIPWIADFRDPMIEEGYPIDPYEYRVYRWIERQTVNLSKISVFTTPGTMRRHVERYDSVPQTRWTVIPNGYDEDDFRVAPTAKSAGEFRIVHSGSGERYLARMASAASLVG